MILYKTKGGARDKLKTVQSRLEQFIVDKSYILIKVIFFLFL